MFVCMMFFHFLFINIDNNNNNNNNNDDDDNNNNNKMLVQSCIKHFSIMYKIF